MPQWGQHIQILNKVMQKEKKDTQSELYKFIDSISPAELAKHREKRQDTSSRDKALFLKKISEIDEILSKLNVKISIKKVQ